MGIKEYLNEKKKKKNSFTGPVKSANIQHFTDRRMIRLINQKRK